MDLRGFISLLEESGELRRVKVEVDPAGEIAEITDRVSKGAGGGRALFFERVKGHAFPVLTNLFGSPRRTAWALWTNDIEALAGRLARELGTAGEGRAEERLGRLVEAPGWLPRLVPGAPCQKKVRREKPDLSILPALQSWPGDGGRFLTLPQVFTPDPATGRINCGMYRVQILDHARAAVHFGPGSDGSRHCGAWRARGKPMPAAIALGGDPALIFAAGVPLPASIEEAAFAGFLRQKPLEMARCLTSGLAVPAAAEFVLEGFFEPGETAPEGPFGNHTGYYVPAAPAPVFRVAAITHRIDPLYVCTVVGPPPMEDCYLAKAAERLFLPLLRIDFPEIRDLNMPLEGIFHGCALLSIRKNAPDRARELIGDLWQGGFLKSSRLLVVLDEDVDVQDLSRSFWRAINEVDPGRDVIIDGRRVGIDATRKVEGEGVAPPEPVRRDEATRKLVDGRWAEYGIE
jgi:4-hydroxy-3-polyprenylbenzoate decarboxylase